MVAPLPPPAPERLFQLAAAVVAPTTLLSALLFYFGWVRTNALYSHFGVEASTLGFSTQDYLLRSVEAVYVPLGVLLILAVVGLWLHAFVLELLVNRRQLRVLQVAVVVLALVGLILSIRGIVGVVFPRISNRDFLVTPLSLGMGTILTAYSHSLWRRSRAAAGRGNVDIQPGWFGTVNLVLVAMLVVLCLFWATSNYAKAYGRGLAISFASELTRRPAVVLYSEQSLYLRSPGIIETILNEDPGARFRVRYSGLRFLTESQGKLFLLPDDWHRTRGPAIVLDREEDVRVEFFPGDNP